MNTTLSREETYSILRSSQHGGTSTIDNCLRKLLGFYLLQIGQIGNFANILNYSLVCTFQLQPLHPEKLYRAMFIRIISITSTMEENQNKDTCCHSMPRTYRPSIYKCFSFSQVTDSFLTGKREIPLNMSVLVSILFTIIVEKLMFQAKCSQSIFNHR